MPWSVGQLKSLNVQAPQSQSDPSPGNITTAFVLLLPTVLRGNARATELRHATGVAMSRTRYRFIEGNDPHFLTCTVVGWIPVFKEERCADIILASLRFLQDQRHLTLYAYVLMENHLHLIASAKQLSKEIGNFKSFTARKIIDLLKHEDRTVVLRSLEKHKSLHKKDRRYQLWQEGSHPQLIQGPEMMRQKVEYIHNNPVRKGLVTDPLEWQYSSARDYSGGSSAMSVCTDW